jgi:uncharacterized protein YndB with AHSA1/START domain
MGVDVTVERVIARPREQVAAFAMDPANDRRWIGALTEVQELTPRPTGPGSRVKRVAAFLGRRMDYVNEIEQYEPGRRLFMRSVQAPFPLTVAYEFEDAPGGTLARIRTQGEGGRYYHLAGPLLNMMVRRGVSRDLRALERELTGRSS